MSTQLDHSRAPQKTDHTKHDNTGCRFDTVSPWTPCHTGGSGQDTRSRPVPEREGCGWLPTTRKDTCVTHMIAERKIHQFITPQHGSARSATAHPVHDFLQDRCARTAFCGSCARQQDSSDSPYVQRAQGSVEPRKTHRVVFTTQHEQSLKTARSKDVARYLTASPTPRPTQPQSEGDGKSETSATNVTSGTSETFGTMNETSGTSETSASGKSETSAGGMCRRSVAHTTAPTLQSTQQPTMTIQCLITPQRLLILTQVHTHIQSVIGTTGWSKLLQIFMRTAMSHQLIRSSQHPRGHPGASRADKSCTAAGIVTEFDQAAFASNHTDSKADVMCTTDAATHEDGQSDTRRDT